MSDQAKATFDIASWEENPFDDAADGAKLTQAVVSKKYAGDIDGTSTTTWLMAYGSDGSATFVGLERVEGTILGRSGTLILQHAGQYSEGSATGTLTVVGGTGAFAEATGTGDFVADPAGAVTLDLTTR
jgi:hypothetical protein